MDDHHTFQPNPRPLKRRKLDNDPFESLLEDEEIVGTSDVDEREFLEAEESQYWRTMNAPIEPVLEILPSDLPLNVQTPKLSRSSETRDSPLVNSPDALDMFALNSSPIRPPQTSSQSTPKSTESPRASSRQSQSPPASLNGLHSVPNRSPSPAVIPSLSQRLTHSPSGSAHPQLDLPNSPPPRPVTPFRISDHLLPNSSPLSPLTPLSRRAFSASPSPSKSRPSAQRGRAGSDPPPSQPPIRPETHFSREETQFSPIRPPAAQEEPLTPFHGRHFRVRRPEQLHPYQIDEVRYRGQMKARGLENAIYKFPLGHISTNGGPPGHGRTGVREELLDPEFLEPDDGAFAAVRLSALGGGGGEEESQYQPPPSPLRRHPAPQSTRAGTTSPQLPPRAAPSTINLAHILGAMSEGEEEEARDQAGTGAELEKKKRKPRRPAFVREAEAKEKLARAEAKAKKRVADEATRRQKTTTTTAELSRPTQLPPSSPINVESPNLTEEFRLPSLSPGPRPPNQLRSRVMQEESQTQLPMDWRFDDQGHAGFDDGGFGFGDDAPTAPETQPRMVMDDKGDSSASQSDAEIVEDPKRWWLSHPGYQIMSKKDRKKFHAWRRVAPRAQIKLALDDMVEGDEGRQQNMQNGMGKTKPSDVIDLTPGDQSESREDEDAGPLKAGQSKVRTARPSVGALQIFGDSESSSEAASGDEEKDVDVDVDVAGGGDDVEEVEIGAWLEESQLVPSAPAPRRARTDAERDKPRGGDLIDRMLSRTRRVGNDTKKTGKATGRVSNLGGALNQGGTIHVVTHEAKRMGGRQTRLPFEPIRKDRTSSDYGDTPRHQRFSSASTPTSHGAPKSGRRSTGGVGTKRAGQKSGNSKRKRQIVEIDEDYDAFMEAIVHNDNPRAAGNAGNPQTKPHRRKLKRKSDVSNVYVHAYDHGASRSDAVLGGVEMADQFDEPLDKGRKRSGHLDFSPDFHIPRLLYSAYFHPSSDIRNGRLAELISLATGEPKDEYLPGTVTFNQHRDLKEDMPMEDFETSLPDIFEAIFKYGTENGAEARTGKMLRVFTCVFFTRTSRSCSVDDRCRLIAAIRVQLHQFINRLSEWVRYEAGVDREPHEEALNLHWFAVELSFRAWCSEVYETPDTQVISVADATDQYVSLLMLRLREYGLERTMDVLCRYADMSVDECMMQFIESRTLELWVFLVHLSLARRPAREMATGSDLFWKLVDRSLGNLQEDADSDLDASQQIWKLVFSLTAISQFSTLGISLSSPRLGAAWNLVSKALSYIRLAADPKLDATRPTKALQMRDRFVRLVASRCLLLCSKWGWKIHDDGGVIRQLCEIFKSRSYANLNNEVPDFPPFIRNSDEEALRESTSNDTAYGTFLKLIARASGDLAAMDQEGTARKKQLTKLLSMAVPVGSTGFTKTNPPLGGELSKLFNRFSAVYLALYLDPTVQNASNRVQQARRYVDFKEADNKSRLAAIRAMMYMGILLRHFRIPLDNILGWADHIGTVLATEYKELRPAVNPPAHGQRIVMEMKLLFGSLRRMLETPDIGSLPATQPRVGVYPDPELLRGELIDNVIRKSGIVDKISNDILEYIQCFLGFRSRVAPAPRRPPFTPWPRDEETEESQDEYSQLDIDFDDPILLAALDGNVEPAVTDGFRELDKTTANTMVKYVAPAMWTFVCKHVGPDDAKQDEDTENFGYDAWVDCWVACANIGVQNGVKDWTMYMQMRSQSWTRIKQPLRRRRVGLRFMHNVLQLDPSAYPRFKDEFIELLFAAVVTARITIEHEYVALLFSIDGLRHPWFLNVPCLRMPAEEDFSFTRSSFRDQRVGILYTIIQNMVARRTGAADIARQRENAAAITCLVDMVIAMGDQLNSLNQGDSRRKSFAEFCQEIIQELRHPSLNDARLIEVVLKTVALVETNLL